MLTFGPPIEAGSSPTTPSATNNAQNTPQTRITTTLTLSTSRSPTPNPKRSSGLTPVEIKSMKDAIDDLLADIKNEGFDVSTTNQTFPELEDPYQYRRPITPPEPVHLSDVKLADFFRPASPDRNTITPIGLGPGDAPPVRYSSKPSMSEAREEVRSRSAEPRRRTGLAPSEAWKRLGSSTYYFADDGRCVSR